MDEMEFATVDANAAALGLDTSDAAVRLELVAATTLSNLLAKYKRLCDVLLPALRSRNHLFNIIHRHKTNYSIVASDVASGRVLGGCTFRVVRAGGENSARLIAEVLLLAVDQRAGVCGRGHGTRLINFVKGLVLRAAAAEGSEPFVLTQSDIGEQARAFWSRQQLQESEEATALVRAMAAWDKKSCIVYDYTVPMLAPLLESSWRCEPHESARAQRTLEDDEDADDDDDDDAGGTLRCDVCSQWKRADAAGGAREAFTCADCRGLMQRSGVAAPPEPEPEVEDEAEPPEAAAAPLAAAAPSAVSPTASLSAPARRVLPAWPSRRAGADAPAPAALMPPPPPLSARPQPPAESAALALRRRRALGRWASLLNAVARPSAALAAARDAREAAAAEKGPATEADVAVAWDQLEAAMRCEAAAAAAAEGRRGGRGRGRGGRGRVPDAAPPAPPASAQLPPSVRRLPPPRLAPAPSPAGVVRGVRVVSTQAPRSVPQTAEGASRAAAAASAAEALLAGVGGGRAPSADDRYRTEEQAAEMVRQLHHAAALDTVAPNTGARLRLWPSIGARLRDGALLRSLVRAGALGALRRWLQTTGDSATTAGATEVMRLRAAVLAGLRALAPYVGAPQMNMSRGLGKLLLLLADAPSTDASIAALAKQTLTELLSRAPPPPAAAAAAVLERGVL